MMINQPARMALAVMFYCAAGAGFAAEPAEADGLRARIAQLESELAEKATALAKAEERADIATQEAAQIGADMAVLQTRVAELEAQVDSQGGPEAAKQAGMSALRQELEEVHARCAQLQEENEKLREKAGLAPGPRSPDEGSTPRPAEKAAAIPVPGKEGFFTSPHAPNEGMIDLRGFSPGTEVKDPYTGRLIYVP